ncbi:MAG: hypothetical protein NUW07_11245, partial [Candidatus Saccharicenans sp.]|nr:hypothetical protein [Candidatus Saccharicenans sp.]
PDHCLRPSLPAPQLVPAAGGKKLFQLIFYFSFNLNSIFPGCLLQLKAGKAKEVMIKLQL